MRNRHPSKRSLLSSIPARPPGHTLVVILRVGLSTTQLGRSVLPPRKSSQYMLNRSTGMRLGLNKRESSGVPYPTAGNRGRVSTVCNTIFRCPRHISKKPFQRRCLTPQHIPKIYANEGINDTSVHTQAARTNINNPVVYAITSLTVTLKRHLLNSGLCHLTWLRSCASFNIIQISEKKNGSNTLVS